MTTPRMLVGMLVGRAGVVVLMKSSMYWRPVVLGRCHFRAYGPFSLCPRHCQGHPDRCQPKLRLPPGVRKREEAVGNRRRRAVGGFFAQSGIAIRRAWESKISRCPRSLVGPDLDCGADRFRCGTRPISWRKWTDFVAELDRFRGGSGPISVRNSTDFVAELDRFRGGSGPISTRNPTDLVAEVDRSRCGTRPISWRKWTDLGAEYDRSR